MYFLPQNYPTLSRGARFSDLNLGLPSCTFYPPLPRCDIIPQRYQPFEKIQPPAPPPPQLHAKPSSYYSFSFLVKRSTEGNGLEGTDLVDHWASATRS